MTHWATTAEERVSIELQKEEPTVLSRKKKTLKWWCVFGQIEVRERIWCSPRQSYLRPLPGRLKVKPRGRSRRLDRVLTDFGSEHSFARAAESVREHYGIDVSASSVRAATLEHAQRAQQQMQEGYKESFRVLPVVGAQHVIAQADGTLIRTVQPGAPHGQAPARMERDAIFITSAAI